MRKIALYLVLPEDRQFAPVARSGGAALRAFLRRRLDTIRWQLGEASLSRYVWERCHNSNKGDVIIREATKQQLRQAFAGDTVVFTEIAWRELDDAAIARVNADHDLFVIAGSGYVALDEQGRVQDRVLRDLPALERIACPKIAYGIGLNFWLSELAADFTVTDAGSRAALQRLLGGLAAIAVRDAATARALQELTPRKVALTGDPALYYDWSASGPAAARDARIPLRIGLNLALHESGLVPLFARLLPIVARFCRDLAAERPVEFLYFAHAEVEYLAPRLLRRHGVAVTLIDAAPGAMLPAYAGLDLHVCQMLHSAIFAVNAGVPVINIAYDGKNLGFFELLAMARWCVPADEVSAALLLDRAGEALREAPALRRQIAAETRRLRDSLDRFLAGLAALERPPVSGSG
jgi:hypothetical protein